jgi:hypothetical protein
MLISNSPYLLQAPFMTLICQHCVSYSLSINKYRMRTVCTCVYGRYQCLLLFGCLSSVSTCAVIYIFLCLRVLTSIMNCSRILYRIKTKDISFSPKETTAFMSRN